MLLDDWNISLQSSDNGGILYSHLENEQNQRSQAPHFHDFSEIFLYISGDVGYYIEGKYYNLEYGDLMIIRPNEIHAPMIRSSCEYERFFIKIPVGSFGSLRAGLTPPDWFIYTQTAGLGSHIKLPEPSMREVVSCFYRISELYESKDDGTLLAYSYFLRILAIIGRCLKSRDWIETKSEFPPLLDKILDCINDEFAVLGTAEEVAERFGITNTYLSRLFAKYVRLSFSRYLNAKRVSQAKILLSGGASVTEACYECGFSDCSHFISVFKNQVGVTPLRYKKAEKSFSADMIE